MIVKEMIYLRWIKKYYLVLSSGQINVWKQLFNYEEFLERQWKSWEIITLIDRTSNCKLVGGN